jgi:hypothetical protein
LANVLLKGLLLNKKVAPFVFLSDATLLCLNRFPAADETHNNNNNSDNKQNVDKPAKGV